LAALCEAFKATKAGLNALSGLYKAGVVQNSLLKRAMMALKPTQVAESFQLVEGS
jgi:hypothetical protein